MPSLEGKKMFLYLAPKKAGIAKKSQQKRDNERREAEAKESSQQQDANNNSGNNLLANAKISVEALEKLKSQEQED